MKAQSGAEIQLYPSLTSVDGGRWSRPFPTCFIPGNKTQYSLYIQEAGWASGLVWTHAGNLETPPGGGLNPEPSSL